MRNMNFVLFFTLVLLGLWSSVTYGKPSVNADGESLVNPEEVLNPMPSTGTLPHEKEKGKEGLEPVVIPPPSKKGEHKSACKAENSDSSDASSKVPGRCPTPYHCPNPKG